MTTGNLLVAQGGGPTAVINCSLVGVIEEAKHYQPQKIKYIIGSIGGMDGIIKENMINLGREKVSDLKQICQKPGAELGSSRREMKESDYGRILSVFKKYDIRYFFYIGGNGSMYTAQKIDELAKDLGYDLKVVGVPKTIDNDLVGTDHCPGFGSAARYIASVTREIGLDIKSLPTPISVIEVLGRNTGWLAAASSLAKEKEGDAPNLIYVPEKKFNLDIFLSDVKKAYKKLGRAVVVVSEGIQDEQGRYLGGIMTEASHDRFGRSLAGGAAAYLVEKISQHLQLRARSEKPGLAARTGIEYISKIDQTEAYGVGTTAVNHAVKKRGGVMMSIERKSGREYQYDIGNIPLKNAALSEKKLPDYFVNKEGNYVADSFRDYCRPLIGDPIRSFGRLSKYEFRKI